MKLLSQGLQQPVALAVQPADPRVGGAHGQTSWQRAVATVSRMLNVVARALRQGPAGSLGWLPLLSLTGSLGILLVTLAYNGARMRVGIWWADPLFWGGLLLLFVPIAARLIATGASRWERIGLVCTLGFGLYLVKALRSPLGFELHDEFLHYRTVDDMLRSGRLFTENPLLPVSTLFPGMETVTSALVRLSGLSIFQAGIVVEAVARLVLILGLYLAYERISDSARVAGIGALLYLINPKVLFFDAQFSYESLALPFVSLVLAALVYRAHAQPADGNRIGLTVVALLGLGAMVVTHHLTSYAFVLFLTLWTAVYYALRVQRHADARERMGPAGLAALGVVLSLSWLVYLAPLVVEYLLPILQGAVHQLLSVIDGRSAGRQLFRDHTGHVPPLWERVTQLAATVLLLVGLLASLYSVWRHYRTSAIGLTLVGTALVYPLSLPFRLTQAGSEASDRAAGFVFVAVAFVLAAGVTRLRPFSGGGRRPVALLTVLAAVVFVGEIIVGVGPSSARLPGPYLVSADSRSIEPQSLDATAWIRASLGPDNRIATDRVNGLLIGSYGEQYPVAHADTGLDVGPVFFAPGFGPVQRGIIRQGKIRYLLVDRRLSTGLPVEGIYIDDSEPDAYRHTIPIALAALTKFARLIDVSQIYDGGDILIYRIGASPREP